MIKCMHSIYVNGCTTGDNYEVEQYKQQPKSDGLEDIDEWDRGAKKSVAEEAISKVKDLWNKTRGFDDPPDYG